MDKVRIQEIAEEAGLSNGDLLNKAKELGFNVKAANSSISVENAGILVDYALSGILPKGFKKPLAKSKITIVRKEKDAIKPLSDKKDTTPKQSSEKKSIQKSVDKETQATTTQEVSNVIAKDDEPKSILSQSLKVDESSEESQESLEKESNTVDISAEDSSIEETLTNENSREEEEDEEEVERPRESKKKLLKKKSLSRGGITIIRKAKVAPVKKSITMTETTPKTLKKKKAKKIAEAKESGEKLDIMSSRDFGGSDEIYDEAEVVLLDFSDKNIYEEMKRQDERKKTEQKKRGLLINSIHLQSSNQTPSSGKRRKKNNNNTEVVSTKIDIIEIPENVRVYEFAEKVGKSVGEVVKILFTLGTMVTKNDFLDKDSIEILSDEFEVEVKTINPLDALDYSTLYDETDDINSQERPPVITIMGHVDHGKTSLLDKIRSAKVADKEAGGITQHVGAYQVEKNGKKITFVDTPGHSAFTQMRARGAQATDIVIIVVAADDGVKPQTKEAISHTKAAGVPLIVAINKMDKPSANPEMVKSQLAQMDILAVDWGGEIEFVEVSAHSGQGIDDLLDVILLQAELMELTADPSRFAKAIVVESSLEKGFGPVANIIVKNGTLKVGDTIIVGNTYGRVRTMRNDEGKMVKVALPGDPVAVIGLNQVPDAGDILVAMENEREAKELAEKRAEYTRAKQLSKSTKATLDDLSALIAEGQLRSLPVILKADVQGSLEAIKGSLKKLKNEEVKVNVIHEGVGGVTDSDVTLADASENAIILGFNVRSTGDVKKKAKELGVEIKTYSIIYNLLDDVKALLGGMMSPVISEEITGLAEVRETFVVGKVGTIAGSKVTEGVITRGSSARLIRDGVVIYTSRISSLKRFTEDAKEVKNGYECGIMLENYNDIKAGDIFETFKNVEEQVTL